MSSEMVVCITSSLDSRIVKFVSVRLMADSTDSRLPGLGLDKR